MTDAQSVRDRVERLGGPLNAVVAIVPARGAVDGPLRGTAVAVKDMIDVAGLPRGVGNPEAMAGPPAAVDAPVVARLRALGADVVALAAMLEYAAGAQHPDLPEARNPADPTRTAGGSSGGSAALVGAGAVPVALGSDTGGSIRLPAHYCGVVGLKPTFGLLPIEGAQPLAPSLDHLGLLAVDVGTATRVLAALTGDPAAPAPERMRIGVLSGQLDDPRLAPDVRAVVTAALARLATAAELVERDAAPLDALNDLVGDLILFEAAQVHGEAMRRRPEHFGAPTRRLLATALEVEEERYRRAVQRRTALVPVALGLLDGVDVLAGPAAPFAAPAVSPPIDTPEGEVEGIFSSPADVTGQPAVVVPCGRTGDGLPVGLQLTGRRGADAALLAVAARVEAVLADDTRKSSV